MNEQHQKCQMNVSEAITEFISLEPPYDGESICVEVCEICKENMLDNLKLRHLLHLNQKAEYQKN